MVKTALVFAGFLWYTFSYQLVYKKHLFIFVFGQSVFLTLK